MEQSVMSNYEITKPPGYVEETSDEESMSPPTSPTLTNPLMNGSNENQSLVMDDVDGGGEHDDRPERGDVGIINGIFNDDKENKIHCQLILPMDDVETDGAGKKNSLPVERKKDAIEKGIQGKKGVVTNDVIHEGAQFKKGDVEENGTPPTDTCRQLKEKVSSSKPQDGNEENIFQLIDEIEETLLSKEVDGTTGRLPAKVEVFLPLVLCVMSELTILKEQVKEFITEKRNLQREVRQLKKEIEERDAKDVAIAVKSPDVPASPNIESCLDVRATAGSVATEKPQKQASADDDQMKKEMKKLRNQNRELQRVNHSWEKYSKKLSTKHEIDLKRKTAQLAASEERRKDLQKRLDAKFKEYDETLILARRSEGQHKAVAEQYKKDRDACRKKYDEMTTKLREWIKEREDKDKEIQRLNKVVERQAARQKPYANIEYAEEEFGCAGHAKATKKVAGEVVNVTAAKLYPHLDDGVDITRKEKQAKDSTLRPRSPRSPQTEPQGNPLNLGKEELKDQVELYRQQIDLFRSDFVQERRDREKAVGQVDSLKKELENTKKKLEEMQKSRFEHDLYGLEQDYAPRRPREETRKVRGGRDNMGYGRQCAYQNYVDLPENHVYCLIDN